MATEFGPSEVMGYLQDAYGLPPHIAAGIAGNIAQESGFDAGINEIAPLVEGSRGGYGLYQLTGPRRRAYEAWSGDRGSSLDDPYAQLDYMMREYGTTERGAYDRLLASRDAGEAAVAMSDHFLRPGIPHLDNRVARAREYAGLTPSSPQGPPQQQQQQQQDLGYVGRARAGLGERLGLSDDQMSGLGRGLQGLGSYIGGLS